MYKEYYGFTNSPFHITPDLNFLFPNTKQQEALSCIKFSVLGNVGITLITGEIGTGKTTLIRQFVSQQDEGSQIACIYNTNVTPEHFLALIIQELSLTPGGESKPKLIKTIQDELQSLRHTGIRPLLIIDDAQNLTLDILEEVRWLSNLQDDERPLIQIMLFGQPELLSKVRSPTMRSLAQRIGVSYHLKPFTLAETSKYIAHRLKTAEGNPDMFTAEAVNRIFKHTHGIPRTINQMCDYALVYGFCNDAMIIDGHTIDQVIKENLPTWLEPMNRTESEPANDLFTQQKTDTTFIPLPATGSINEAIPHLKALEDLAHKYSANLHQLLKFLLTNKHQLNLPLESNAQNLKEKKEVKTGST